MMPLSPYCTVRCALAPTVLNGQTVRALRERYRIRQCDLSRYLKYDSRQIRRLETSASPLSPTLSRSILLFFEHVAQENAAMTQRFHSLLA